MVDGGCRVDAEAKKKKCAFLQAKSTAAIVANERACGQASGRRKSLTSARAGAPAAATAAAVRRPFARILCKQPRKKIVRILFRRTVVFLISRASALSVDFVGFCNDNDEDDNNNNNNDDDDDEAAMDELLMALAQRSTARTSAGWFTERGSRRYEACAPASFRFAELVVCIFNERNDRRRLQKRDVAAAADRRGGAQNADAHRRK